MGDVNFAIRHYRVCALSDTNKKFLEGSLVTLKDAQNMLQVAISDAVAARRQEEFGKNAELVARALEIACDAVIAVFAAKTGPVGTAISYGYGTTKNIVQANFGGSGSKLALKKFLDTKVIAADELLKNNGAIGDAVTLYDLSRSVYEFVELYSRPVGDYNIGGMRQQLINIQSKIKAVEDTLNGCRRTGKIVNIQA